MNPWIAVISGFVLGWALEFFIDCVWWGNRCTYRENEQEVKKHETSSTSNTAGIDKDTVNEKKAEETKITSSQKESSSFSENYHKEYEALKKSSDLIIKNLEADLAIAGEKYEEDLGTYQNQQEKLEEKIFKIQTELELFANNTEVQPLKTEFVSTNNELIKEKSAVEILLEENKHLTSELKTLQETGNVEKKTDETFSTNSAQDSDTDNRPGAKPQSLSTSRPDQPDDLKRIRGIGPKIEQLLNKLGIYYFHQIVDFTPDNRAWVNSYLRFSGRIEREDWINQAKSFTSDE